MRSSGSPLNASGCSSAMSARERGGCAGPSGRGPALGHNSRERRGATAGATSKPRGAWTGEKGPTTAVVNQGTEEVGRRRAEKSGNKGGGAGVGGAKRE